MTISPNRRSTKRGRPLVTDGQFRCSRCRRMANQRRASWPGEDLCYSCFYTAMRTRGICPGCGHNGVLPGLAIDADRQPICLSCAGIPADFTCRRCGAEGDFYRRGACARCALREDLTALMIDAAHDPQAMAAIVETLCRVERPASILTWKRSPRVQELLIGLASGEIPLTHQGLDEAGTDKAANHLRSLLEHAGILAARDEPLAQFERWLPGKLEAVTEPAVRAPVEQFARWHHLRRLRKASVPGKAPMPARDTPNKRSPRRSSFLPGCTVHITARWPAAGNRTSMNGWHRVPPRDQRSETCWPGPRKPG